MKLVEIDGGFVNPEKVAFVVRWVSDTSTSIYFSGNEDDYLPVYLPIGQVVEILKNA